MDDSVSLPPAAVAGKTLSCIVIDDEPIARQGMALLIGRHPALALKGMFPGPSEALAWMESESVDLVFLDIEMPGMKGVDLPALLPSGTMVIFTTAYSEYAVLSYDLYAVDYLLKPIGAPRFDCAVKKALSRAAVMGSGSDGGSPPILTLRADRRFVNIDPESIVFIEGVKDYVRIHTDAGRVVSRITIKSLLQRLPAKGFLRIHKSYVVNLSRIKAYDLSNVVLRSGSDSSQTVELPVGAAFRSEIVQLAGKGQKPDGDGS